MIERMNGFTSLIKTLLKGKGSAQVPDSFSVSVVPSLLAAERGEASKNFTGYFGTTSIAKEALVPIRGWE